MPFVIFIILALLFSQSFGLESVRCGTLRFFEDLKNPKKNVLAKKYNAETISGVKEERTTHFIIYYVTEGTHAATIEYIKSLAIYLEQAYDLHKNTLGMKSIIGTARTTYYNKVVPSGLYPVEVIDTGESDYCGDYGLTFPNSSTRTPKATQISIENNFIYDVNCTVQGSLVRKGTPFTSRINGDYSKKWNLALKVTAFHELYHAFQFTYLDLEKYPLQVYSFWLESSAVGVEEIGAPDVDDYIDYLKSNFKYPGTSFNNLENGDKYGWASLYLFLHSQIDPRFDSAIWSYFLKYPKDNFGVQLARLADSLGKNAEDLFHEYAKQVFYSGKSRAKSSPYKLFWEDMPKWPEWTVKAKSPARLQSGAIDFIRTENEPNTDSVAKKTLMRDGDNPVWVLSRLLEKEYVAPNTTAKELAAYPNPWNPKRSKKINFGILPKNSSGVEIRSSNGALLKRIEGEAGYALDWQPKKIPAPGILYYRALPYGKNKVLIVQY